MQLVCEIEGKVHTACKRHCQMPRLLNGIKIFQQSHRLNAISQRQGSPFLHMVTLAFSRGTCPACQYHSCVDVWVRKLVPANPQAISKVTPPPFEVLSIWARRLPRLQFLNGTLYLFQSEWNFKDIFEKESEARTFTLSCSSFRPSDGRRVFERVDK